MAGGYDSEVKRSEKGNYHPFSLPEWQGICHHTLYFFV